MTKSKKTYILTTIICLIPILAAILLYSKLPDQIATHWDSSGQANGWSSKFVGTIVFPGILLLINLFFPTLMRIDPKYSNMGDKLKTVVQWIIPMVSVFASGVTLGSALGVDVPVTLIGPMLLGVLFVVIGNYLPTTRQSYTLGIKLPWTLNSEENWNRTHRKAGRLWVVLGIVIIAGALTPWRSYTTMICIIAMILIPTDYSYLLYRKGI